MARGSRWIGTSIGPRALAVGWKNARAEPNTADRAKIGHRPPPNVEWNANPTEVRSWAR